MHTDRNIEKAALYHCLVTIIISSCFGSVLRRILGYWSVSTSPEGLLAQLHPIEHRREWRRRRRIPLEKKWEQIRTESCLYLFMEQQSTLRSPCVALLSRRLVLALSSVLYGIFCPDPRSGFGSMKGADLDFQFQSCPSSGRHCVLSQEVCRRRLQEKV